MSNKLENVTTQYRKFNENQALTADQLNEFIDFFEDQDRLSRTSLIGVGLACGFKTSITTEKNDFGDIEEGEGVRLNITQGVGITTDGDILTLQDLNYDLNGDLIENEVSIDITDKEFTHYRVYEDEINYAHFRTKMQLWELRNESEIEKGEETSYKRLTENDLKEKIAFLYLESYANEETPCEDIDCDNQGEEQVANLKVLLTDREGAEYITQSRDSIYIQQKVYADLYDDLPNIEVARAVLSPTTRTPEGVKDRFRNAISNTNVSALIEAMGMILNTFGISLNKDLGRVINTYLTLNGDDFQYRYDFLKDLVNTYTEIKSLILHLKTNCSPNIYAFPKHILLGEVGAAIQPGNDIAFRHDFYKSSILGDAGDSFENIKFLIKRFDTKLNSVNSKLAISREIKITPSLNSVLLGNRAIPFYYKGGLSIIKLWNYEKTKTGRELYNLSYNRSQLSSDDFIQNPLAYSIEDFDFFRIEGHIGQDYMLVYNEINKIRRAYGLPFQIKAIGLNEESESLIASKPLSINKLRDELAIISKGLVSTNIEKSQEAFKSLSILDRQLQLLAPLQDLAQEGLLSEESQISVDPIISRPQIIEEGEIIAPDLDIPISDEIPVIIEEENEGKVNKIQTELLSSFMERNSGLEHMGGVPVGGTFILLYYINNDGTSFVVADFSLPYVCCTKDDTVTLVLPTNSICADASSFELTVYPLDAEIQAYVGNQKINAIEQKGNQKIFIPARVPEKYHDKEITFTVNGDPVENTLVVNAIPKTQVAVNSNIIINSVGTEATVTFNVSNIEPNSTYEWNFGDRTPIANTSPDANGNVVHVYRVITNTDTDIRFLPTVKITNSKGCSKFIRLTVNINVLKTIECGDYIAETSTGVPYSFYIDYGVDEGLKGIRCALLKDVSIFLRRGFVILEWNGERRVLDLSRRTPILDQTDDTTLLQRLEPDQDSTSTTNIARVQSADYLSQDDLGVVGDINPLPPGDSLPPPIYPLPPIYDLPPIDFPGSSFAGSLYFNKSTSSPTRAKITVDFPRGYMWQIKAMCDGLIYTDSGRPINPDTSGSDTSGSDTSGSDTSGSGTSGSGTGISSGSSTISDSSISSGSGTTNVEASDTLSNDSQSYDRDLSE